jgi:hypothetical protein
MIPTFPVFIAPCLTRVTVLANTFIHTNERSANSTCTLVISIAARVLEMCIRETPSDVI